MQGDIVMALKKRLISTILIAVMVVAFMPTLAFADDFTGDSGTWHNNILWDLSADGVMTISGEGYMYDENVSSTSYPWNKYKEKIKTVVVEEGVKSIGRAAFFESSVERITTASTVSKVGDRAFESCTNLSFITIPKEWKTVGKYLFEGCTSLTDVEIEDGVSTISYQMFSGCTSLSSISLPNSIELTEGLLRIAVP